MPYWTTYRRPVAEPTSAGAWVAADADEATWLLDLYGEELEKRRAASSEIPSVVRKVSLPFYATAAQLYELACDPYIDNAPLYVISDREQHVLLDGSEDAIYRFNAIVAPKLDRENVADYIRFFTAHSVLPGGRWIITESLDDFRWRFDPCVADNSRVDGFMSDVITVVSSKGGLAVKATGLHDDTLYGFSFQVSDAGKVHRSRGLPKLRDLPVVRDALDDFPGGPGIFNLKAGWEPLASELNEEIREHFRLTDKRCSWTILAKKLSFYPHVKLLRIERHDDLGGFFVYAVWGEYLRESLELATQTIFSLVEKEELRLTDETVIDYVAFFCTFMNQGDEGIFRLTAAPSDLNTTARPEGFQAPLQSIVSAVKYSSLTPATLRYTVESPEIITATKESEGWRVGAHIHYGPQLFLATLQVQGDGVVNMLSDTQVISDIPSDDNKNRTYSMMECRARDLSFRSAEQTAPSSTKAQERTSDLAVEKNVLSKFVEQQLIGGLRKLEGQSFHVTAQAKDAEVLAKFAEFVMNSKAAIIFESDIPFCEEIIQKILVHFIEGRVPVAKVEPFGYDETIAYLKSIPKRGILMLSFHQITELRNPERFAYQVATTETALLIGCAERGILPEPLRRVADLVVPLERMDRDLFGRVFKRILDHAVPEKSINAADTWQGYVLPEDFYQPLREQMLGALSGAQAGSNDGAWDAEQTIDHIRGEVTERLNSASVGNAPPLDEVHGLGEAKSVAQDLIADIQDALSGRIEWDQVDRGILLAGPPGTGKTMLARSIARACGVRFISSSAASWVAGTEHLGQHIRKIHGIFAEARRYAPSILFVDELDSLGSRENAADHNASYQTEIVNTVLQEIQGFQDTVPVFVIGATNHVENIDPALRRAGRLDNTVHIRRPNRKALASIFEYHLDEYRKTGVETGAIDTGQLGAIAWGSTGADVERFVRDGARRARKEGVSLETRHLAAAASGRPRGKYALQEIDAAVLERTAVHEAGHTVALIACEHYPIELSMVSIVPRDDGSLGFTGFSGDPDQAITRRGFQEYLRIMMAGRAAEEVVYGANAVSSGAGGESDSSDLAQATHTAIRLVDRMGMGEPPVLRWKSVPDDDTLDQARLLLDAAYADALGLLRENKKLLDDISERLVEKHEVLSDELHAIARQYGWQIGADVSAESES